METPSTNKKVLRIFLGRCIGKAPVRLYSHKPFRGLKVRIDSEGHLLLGELKRWCPRGSHRAVELWIRALVRAGRLTSPVLAVVDPVLVVIRPASGCLASSKSCHVLCQCELAALGTKSLN